MFNKGKTRSRTEKKPVNKSLTKCVIAIFVAAIAWIGLTMAESYILTDKNVTTVIVASSAIPKGTIINSDNVNDYFTEKTVNTSLLTENSVTDADSIKGKVLIDIDAGAIVTSSMYYDTSYVNDSIKNPIVYSFAPGGTTNAVNGSIREGDIVDIYGTRTNETTGENENYLIKQNVYIVKAYDGNNAEIASSDQTTGASTFIINLESDEVTTFNEAITQGALTLVKKDPTNEIVQDELKGEGAEYIIDSNNAKDAAETNSTENTESADQSAESVSDGSEAVDGTEIQ